MLLLPCLYISALNSSLPLVSKLAPFSLFSHYLSWEYFFWSHSVQYGSFLNEDWHHWDYGFVFSPSECELLLQWWMFTWYARIHLVCILSKKTTHFSLLPSFCFTLCFGRPCCAQQLTKLQLLSSVVLMFPFRHFLFALLVWFLKIHYYFVCFAFTNMLNII